MLGHGREVVKPTESKYILDSRAALLNESPRFVWITLYLLFGVIIAAGIWAYHAKIDVATTANGKVVSSANLQIVQNLEGGIVKAIYVKQGEKVKAGQLLAKLDDTQFSANYKRDLTRKAYLETEIVRLTAQSEGKEKLEFSAELQKSHPEFIAEAQQHFQEQRRASQENLKILNDNYALAKNQLAIISPLVDKGSISRLERLNLEREINSMEGRIKERIETERSTAREELNKVRSDYAVLSEQIASSKDRLTRTDVVAPTPGIINRVNITTIGEVVNPAGKMFEIVPDDNDMTIEVRIPPSDIGFIQIGQKARVSVSAFDYSVYGSLDAVVTGIGADVITDAQGNDYYEVSLKAEKNYLGQDKTKLRILPGMSVTANILTSKRTVFSYLLKPFIDLSTQPFNVK